MLAEEGSKEEEVTIAKCIRGLSLGFHCQEESEETGSDAAESLEETELLVVVTETAPSVEDIVDLSMTESSSSLGFLEETSSRSRRSLSLFRGDSWIGWPLVWRASRPEEYETKFSIEVDEGVRGEVELMVLEGVASFQSGVA